MDDGRRKADRKSVGLLVKLNHPDVGNFVQGFATNISAGGMFIRSKKPHPVGTEVRFQIELANGARVMRGTAVVRWIREPGDPTGTTGMGLQFREVDEETQALVDTMLGSAGAGSAVTPAIEPAPKGQKPASARPATSKPPAAKPAAASAPARSSAVAARAAPASAAADLAGLFEEGDAQLSPPPPVAAKAPPAKPPPAKPSLVPPPPAAKPAPPRAAPPPPMEDFGASELAGLSVDLDEPLDLGLPPPPAAAAPEPEVPPPAEEDVNISIDALVRGTAPRGKALPPEPAPEVELELEPADTSEEVLEGLEMAIEPEVELEPDPEPAEVRAAEVEIEIEPDVRAGVTAGGGSEMELDLGGEEEELELDLPAGAPRRGGAAAPPPKKKRKKEAPAQAPAAKAAKPAVAAAPAAPAARAAPPQTPAKGQPALPNIRREAPKVAAPATAQARPVLLDAPKPAAAAAAPALGDGPIFLKPPATLSGTGPVIGIDLGTTNSCVALLNGNRPVVLRSKEGYNTLPSVVSLTNAKKLLVSHRAKGQMVLNPHDTIYGAKRLVGRLYDSATVRQVRERFHYNIVPDASGRAAVKLGEHVLSLDEVQGLILRECKEMAEGHLNQKVERAVITVPAYYSEPQREAVRKAGAMAGLKVERILNEPTAAALAYGLNREMKKRVLVYDLGGGTFDATLLRIDKNVFEVLATGGDIFLGGLDFDNQIVDLLLQRFQETEKIAFTGDSVALSRVTDAAERLKIALSERSTFDVHIPMLMMDETGKPRDLRCSISRGELEETCLQLINRTLDVVRDVLLDAKLKPSDVDEIILVGGQSRMPMVRDKIKELFNKPPHASVNADEAVALGAALYSGAVDKVSSVVLIDVLPMTIGVAMPGGGFKRVIERNTPLPVEKSFGLATSRDNETILELSLFQGEDALVSSNEYLGTVRVEDLPKGPKGSVKLAVTLKVDSECVLHVEARELSTRKQVKATLATRYTPEALNQKLNISADAIQAAEAKRSEELKERGGRFWGFLKKVLRR